MCFHRRILKISRVERVTNDEVLNQVQKERQLLQRIERGQNKFLGHIIRKEAIENPREESLEEDKDYNFWSNAMQTPEPSLIQHANGKTLACSVQVQILYSSSRPVLVIAHQRERNVSIETPTQHSIYDFQNIILPFHWRRLCICLYFEIVQTSTLYCKQLGRKSNYLLVKRLNVEIKQK